MMTNLTSRLRAFVARRPSFAGNERGVAAIEFALVLPVAMAMLGFCVVLGEALEIAQKSSLTARTIVDIVSQAPNGQLSTTQMQTILAASAATMTPYDASKLSMTVAEIQCDASGNATVTWSATYQGTALGKGAAFTLPTGMNTANATYIYGIVNYNYQPLIFSNLVPSNAINLTDAAYFAPRTVTSIAYPYPN